MTKVIAVVEDEANSPAGFDAIRHLCVYHKREEEWRRGETFSPRLDWSTLHSLRAGVSELMRLLGSCRILAAKKINGVPYAMLTQSGYALFEIQEISVEILDGIVGDVRESIGDSRSALPIYPVATDMEGFYFLDLVLLQEQRPEISSKMALRDFLATRRFVEVEVTCSHFPPWLETFLPAHGLSCMEKISNGIRRYVIRPAACGVAEL
jgi:hypothetical protein